MLLRNRRIQWISLAALGAVMARARGADAQVLERFALHAEGGAAFMLDATSAQRFGLGGQGAVRLGFDVAGPLSVQASVGGWTFDARVGPRGWMASFEGGLRFAPRIAAGMVGGPTFDANAGLGITGDLQRVTFNAALGWEFVPAEAVRFGPFVRYGHIVQPDAELVPDDTQMLTVGVALTFRVPRRDEGAARGDAGPSAQPAQPAADGDRDAVPDDRDACPSEPEDRDGFRDEDGCVDGDNDGDGLADRADRCPDQAEVRNGFEDEDGCADVPPAPAQAQGEGAAQQAPASGGRAGRPGVVIARPVLYHFGSHGMRGQFSAVVAEVCEYMRTHPDARVQIAGHADDVGAPGGNLELSSRRAAGVGRRLIRCGVAPGRIETVAYSATRPACSERTTGCRRQNRRVEFYVVEPGTP